MFFTEQLLRKLSFAFVVTLAFPLTGSAADVGDFINFTRNGLPGRLFIPAPATQSPEGQPLVLYLHGGLQRGNDNLAQVDGNIDNLLANAQQRGAYLYAPQTSTNWTNSDSQPTLDTIMDAIDAINSFGGNVDYDRLYVTGISMGGGGTWNMLNEFSDRFAAGSPMAGISPAFGFEPERLVDTPVWAFHQQDDPVVSYLSTENTVNSILGAAGQPNALIPTSDTFISDTLDLRYTLWPTGGHNVWRRAYGTPELHDWMFSRSLDSRSVPEPGAIALFALAFVGAGLRRAK